MEGTKGENAAGKVRGAEPPAKALADNSHRMGEG